MMKALANILESVNNLALHFNFFHIFTHQQHSLFQNKPKIVSKQINISVNKYQTKFIFRTSKKNKNLKSV